jgi:hypothetical protein
MSTIDDPSNGGISMAVDPTAQAGRFSPRPIEYNGQIAGNKAILGGHYFTQAGTGPILVAAGANLFYFRNVDPNKLVVIHRVWCPYVYVASAVTAQRIDPIVMFLGRGMKTPPNAGGSFVTYSNTPGSGRYRSTMAPSALLGGANAIAIATANTGLTGGVNTETDAVNYNSVWPGNLVAIDTGTSNPGDWCKNDKLGGHPLVFAQYEGFVINWGGTALATGTVAIGIGVEWAEVAQF